MFSLSQYCPLVFIILIHNTEFFLIDFLEGIIFSIIGNTNLVLEQVFWPTLVVVDGKLKNSC